MNSNETGDFYFGISEKKIYICFFEKGKIDYKERVDFEIPDSLNNNLNFRIISNLLKNNIRKIEKNLGFFLNSGNISIKSNSTQRISFSIKNIFDEKILDKKVINDLITSSIQKFHLSEKKLSIIHIMINKFVVDDRIYEFFPKNINFKKIILEIEFICLDKNIITKVNNLFSECKVNVNKIVSYEYAKKFSNDATDDTMCVSAVKVLNGINQSEVYLNDSISKKRGIFYKIFDLFG